MKLPPISFGSRGFVCKDGSVIGWSIIDGMHRDYFREHAGGDLDFLTRWRQWTEGDAIEIDEPGPGLHGTVERWIEEHKDEVIPMPRKEIK